MTLYIDTGPIYRCRHDQLRPARDSLCQPSSQPEMYLHVTSTRALAGSRVAMMEEMVVQDNDS
jgi:hypothetical protein